MSGEIIPAYGSIGTFVRLSGLGRSLVVQMVRGGTLGTVNIEGRQYVAVQEGLAMLAEAKDQHRRVLIPGEFRAKEQARKTRLREERRAAKRAAEAAVRRARRQRGGEEPQPTV